MCLCKYFRFPYTDCITDNISVYWLYHGQSDRCDLVSSTNKTDRHDLTEILLKVALNIINPNPNNSINIYCNKCIKPHPCHNNIFHISLIKLLSHIPYRNYYWGINGVSVIFFFKMSLSIRFVPSHINSIFTANTPILYLSCNQICN
jgi:hypothetical protein